MHTAICTFEDKAPAEQAVDRLVRAGFARHDIHLEHRHPDGTPMEEEHRDRDVAGKFSFFERLFGAGRLAPDADRYTRAVEQGLYVVLVEHQDEGEAERAQDVLHGLEAGDVSLVHRAGQPPLREVVSDRVLEKPVASKGGWGEQDRLEVVDEDRPIASPSIRAQNEDKEPKPR
jgi:hypothetical protein